MLARKLAVEALGTALLVFFAVGVATLSFGDGIALAGTSLAAGVVATALTFGLVMLVLVYSLGPVSGCHINPAVTVGFVCSGRMPLSEAAGYWLAQFVGGIAGAAVLYGVMRTTAVYQPGVTGLGANGWGEESDVGISAGGAFAAEVVLTFLFVFVVLSVTSRLGHRNAPGFAGIPIGFALAVVHLVGIPLTSTSVNPARALGPAIFAGGGALGQVWLFILAPVVGGLIAGGLHTALLPQPEPDASKAQKAA
ncbi:aquaporin [Saccharopolyspora sp. CA-218241]|uniref:aquaporin n=1 Tax=Saccharopolyspora sp. CA-218241 TaxID=3240027 RepID=UPI003D97E965